MAALPQPLLRSMLLLEPDSLLRRTVAGVSRDLQLADVHEASSVDAAERLLSSRRFDALFIALDDHGHGLQLLASVRSGQWACAPAIPAAVMATTCGADLALRLKELNVRRMLLKPFKVKGVLETVVSLAEATPTAG